MVTGRRNVLPKIGILIATFNDENTLSLCLESVSHAIVHYKRLGGSAEVVIIDDGSFDSTPRILKSWQETGRIKNLTVENQANMGITKSLRRAFTLLHRDTLFIIRIDADAFFMCNDWIHKFISFMIIDERIGSVGPCIMLPNGTIASCGLDFYNIKKKEPIFRLQGKSYPSLLTLSIEEVFALSGTCACFRKDVWTVDEFYTKWTEDIDQSLTVRLRNKKNFVIPDTALCHAGHGFLRGVRASGFDPEDKKNAKYLLRLALSEFAKSMFGYSRWIRLTSYLKSKSMYRTNTLRSSVLLAEKNNAYFKEKWGFNEYEFDSAAFESRYAGSELCWKSDPQKKQITKEILKKYNKYIDAIK